MNKRLLGPVLFSVLSISTIANEDTHCAAASNNGVIATRDDCTLAVCEFLLYFPSHINGARIKEITMLVGGEEQPTVFAPLQFSVHDEHSVMTVFWLAEELTNELQVTGNYGVRDQCRVEVVFNAT